MGFKEDCNLQHGNKTWKVVKIFLVIKKMRLQNPDKMSIIKHALRNNNKEKHYKYVFIIIVHSAEFFLML